jgi:uncharacterized membrane protein YheB (UPF0754 family)
MLINALLKILAGGVVGYGTNALAIQMLFKEYFKVRLPGGKTAGLGGVVIKERQQFEDKVSALVEEKVLSAEALAERLRSEEMRPVLEDIMRVLFEEVLPAKLPPTLAEVPGFAQSLERLWEHLSPVLAQSLGRVLHKGSNTLRLSDILSEDTQGHLLEQLLQTIAQQLNQQPKPLDDYLADLLERLLAQPLAQTLPQEWSTHLAQLLKTELAGLPELLRHQYEVPLRALFDTAWEQLLPPEQLQKTTQNLLSNSFYELMPEASAAQLPSQLQQYLRQLLEEESGQQVVGLLLKIVLERLEREEMSVAELLAPQFKISFETFLATQLPALVKAALLWVQSKKHDIDLMVNQAFDKELSWVGRSLVRVFVGDVAQKVGLDKRIIKALEKLEEDPKATIENLSAQIIELLTQKRIKDLAASAQDTLVPTLTPAIVRFLAQGIESESFAQRLEQILRTPLHRWIPEAWVLRQIQHRLPGLLYHTLTERWLFTPKAAAWLTPKLQTALEQWFAQPPSTWLGATAQPKEWAIQLRTLLLDALQTQQQTWALQLSEVLQPQLAELSLGSLIATDGEEFQAQSLQWMEALRQWLETQASQTDLPKMAQQGLTAERLAPVAAQTLQERLSQALPGIFERFEPIRNLVFTELNKLPDSRLLGMVKDALGKELKPLSLFGGLLGIGTGVILLSLPEMQTWGWGVLIAVLAYGITGWGTNWLAIKMLFRPYKAWYLLPRYKRSRIPFTPGVVPANRPRFSASMGRFIGERLLDKENLTQRFNSQRDTLAQGLQKGIAQDDYHALQQLLNTHRSTLAAQGANALTKSLKQEAAQWLRKLPETAKKRLQSPLQEWYSLQQHSAQLCQTLQQPTITSRLQEGAVRQLQRYWQETTTIDQRLPKTLQQQLQAQPAARIQQQLEGLGTDWLHPQWLPEQVEWGLVAEKLLQTLNQPIGGLIAAEKHEIVKQQTFEILKKWLQSTKTQQYIEQLLERWLNNEAHPDRKLGELFDGALLRGVDRNIDRILEWAKQWSLEVMQSQKKSIATRAYEEAYENSKAAYGFKSSIEKATNNLIDIHLPDFLEREKAKLKEIIKQEVQVIAQKPLAEGNLLALNPQVVQGKIIRFLEDPSLLTRLEQLCRLLIEERIFTLNPAQLLKLDVELMEGHLKQLLTLEISRLQAQVQQQVAAPTTAQALAQPAAQLLTHYLEQHWYSRSLASLLPLSEAAAAQLTQNILTLALPENTPQQTPLMGLIQHLLAGLEAKPLNHWLSDEVWEQRLQTLTQTLLDQPEFSAELQTQLQTTIEQLLAELLPNLAPQTKDFVLELLLQAALQTLSLRLMSLIKALEFKEVVVTQISHMEPQALEDLFDAFAGKYFVYLINYGFGFGAIFGLAIDVLLLWVLRQYVL